MSLKDCVACYDVSIRLWRSEHLSGNAGRRNPSAMMRSRKIVVIVLALFTVFSFAAAIGDSMVANDHFRAEIIRTVTYKDLNDQSRIISLMDWTNEHVRHLPTRPPPDRPVRDVILDGTGWCDDRVRVLVSFALQMGLPARMVFLYHTDGLNEHSIAEVFLNGRWSVFDVDHDIYYPFDNGTLANAMDIASNPYLVDRVPDPWRSEINGEGMSSFYKNIVAYETFGTPDEFSGLKAAILRKVLPTSIPYSLETQHYLYYDLLRWKIAISSLPEIAPPLILVCSLALIVFGGELTVTRLSSVSRKNFGKGAAIRDCKYANRAAPTCLLAFLSLFTGLILFTLITVVRERR